MRLLLPRRAHNFTYEAAAAAGLAARNSRVTIAIMAVGSGAGCDVASIRARFCRYIRSAACWFGCKLGFVGEWAGERCLMGCVCWGYMRWGWC